MKKKVILETDGGGGGQLPEHKRDGEREREHKERNHGSRCWKLPMLQILWG